MNMIFMMLVGWEMMFWDLVRSLSDAYDKVMGK